MVDSTAVTEDAGHHRGVFGRLAHWCGAHRRLVIGAWILAFVLLAVPSVKLKDQLVPGGFQIAGSQSDEARNLLKDRFTQDFPSSMTAVLTASASERAALDAVADDVTSAVKENALVGGVAPPVVATSGDQLVATIDIGLTKGIDEALRDADTVIDHARAAATDAVAVDVTGAPATFTDFNKVNEKNLAKAEAIQLPIILIILVLVLGSLVAAGLPVLSTVMALIITQGLLFFVAQVTDLSIYVGNVVPLIGIGVGVDYSLFIVNRFREELLKGHPPLDAARITGATAGRAIVFSGVTVAVALAGMLAVGVPLFTAFAIGTIAVVLFSVLTAITLMPAVLTALGPKVFKWNVGRRIAGAVGIRTGRREGADVDTSGFWERWARTVMRHPWPFIGGATAILLLLAAPMLVMDLGSSGSSALPSDTTSARGATTIASVYGAGAIAPNEIVIDGRGKALRGSPAPADLAKAVAADSEVASVSPKITYSDDGTLALVKANAKHGDDSQEAQDLVGRISDEIVPTVASLEGMRVVVGGAASQNRDFTARVVDNLPRVIGLVMIVTFLVLVVLFRSLLLPLKAVVMTLLSSFAAYGVLVMVFQWGWFDSLLGFDHLGHVTNWVPPFLFSILFGLSMDYEVFLLSRIREHRERYGDDRAAVAWGLARTGYIISAAALIMVVVFMSFFVNPLIPLKEASLGLAVAVFLDATLVRLVLVPAFMRVAGRWNWWLPGPLDRVLPRFDEGELGAP